MAHIIADSPLRPHRHLYIPSYHRRLVVVLNFGPNYGHCVASTSTVVTATIAICSDHPSQHISLSLRSELTITTDSAQSLTRCACIFVPACLLACLPACLHACRRCLYIPFIILLARHDVWNDLIKSLSQLMSGCDCCARIYVLGSFIIHSLIHSSVDVINFISSLMRFAVWCWHHSRPLDGIVISTRSIK